MSLKRRQSRKKTPWDEEANLTETQEFLKEHYAMHYAERHRAVGEPDNVPPLLALTNS